MAEVKKVVKKRTVKTEPEGKVYLHASFNNIIITLTNKTGQAISWSSAGKMGFKGSKKNTPYAAGQAAGDCGKQVSYTLFSHPLQAAELFSCQFIEIAHIVDEAGADQLLHKHLTQSLNVHRSTRGKMLDAAVKLSRALNIDAP